jgi:nucleoside-diphosphate-sugar epimerase
VNAEHVIFGTGAIGLATAAVLYERGETVRMVNRSGHAAAPDGVEVVAGNAADPAFTAAVASGARVVYQTLNPPYHRWPEEFPSLQAGVLAAARATGARMVSVDNVYSYGRPNGHPLVEGMPDGAHTVKGRLRAAMAADLLAEHRAGRIEVVIAKASD